MKMTKKKNPKMSFVKAANMTPKLNLPKIKLTPRPTVPFKKSFYTA